MKSNGVSVSSTLAEPNTLLNGYAIDGETGVLRQIAPKPFTYDAEYLTTYERYPTAELSRIRLAYLDRVIGRFQRVLDVGYGDGAFLTCCNQARLVTFGVDVTGVPPPEGTKQIETLGVPVDVVTFFDVLEHREDIRATIDEVSASHVVISAPCYNESWTPDEFRTWHHRKPDEHIWHFSPASVYRFMVSRGYEMIDLSDVEDRIRKGSRPGWNILTGVFRRRGV